MFRVAIIYFFNDGGARQVWMAASVIVSAQDKASCDGIVGQMWPDSVSGVSAVAVLNDTTVIAYDAKP
jgi:hypothetical protein